MKLQVTKRRDNSSHTDRSRIPVGSDHDEQEGCKSRFVCRMLHAAPEMIRDKLGNNPHPNQLRTGRNISFRACCVNRTLGYRMLSI